VPGPLGPHSYDPGIARNGVLWATAIPDGAVQFEFSEGEALLSLRNVDLFDAFTVPNSLDPSRPWMGKVPVSAKIDSLEIHWSGAPTVSCGGTVSGFSGSDPTSKPADKFAGSFKETGSQISVSVTTLASTADGFHFESTGTDSSNYAQIGTERNGRFV
jgi:hypothetical protein